MMAWAKNADLRTYRSIDSVPSAIFKPVLQSVHKSTAMISSYYFLLLAPKAAICFTIIQIMED